MIPGALLPVQLESVAEEDGEATRPIAAPPREPTTCPKLALTSSVLESHCLQFTNRALLQSFPPLYDLASYDQHWFARDFAVVLLCNNQ